MNLFCRMLACAAVVLTAQVSLAENKKLLLVTDSGGFVHDSVGLAEQILKEIGPKNGIDVTYVDIDSNYGHDAFLLETDRLAELAKDFLRRA